MRLTLTTLTDAVYQLEVSADLELENFKALCEVESGIPAAEMSLLHNGRPLYDDKKPLKDYGIADGDILIIQHLRGSGGGGGGGGGIGRGIGRGQVANPPPPFPTPSSSSSSSPFNLDFSNIQVPGSSSSAAGASASSRRVPPAADLTATDQERLLNDPVQLRDALLSRPEEVAILKVRGNNTFFCSIGGRGDCVPLAGSLTALEYG